MTKDDFYVGRSVYVLQVLNCRRKPLEERITEVKVKTVGRKYIVVDFWGEMKFDISDNFRQVTQYSPNYRLYLTKEDIYQEQRRCNDINLVEKYVNQIFYIDRDEMDDLEENEYYFDDLIGLKIIDGNNNEYGEVVDVLDLPSSAVIEIKLKNDKKIMIPFVGVYINDVTKEYILIERIEEFL